MTVSKQCRAQELPTLGEYLALNPGWAGNFPQRLTHWWYYRQKFGPTTQGVVLFDKKLRNTLASATGINWRWRQMTRSSTLLCSWMIARNWRWGGACLNWCEGMGGMGGKYDSERGTDFSCQRRLKQPDNFFNVLATPFQQAKNTLKWSSLQFFGLHDIPPPLPKYYQYLPPPLGNKYWWSLVHGSLKGIVTHLIKGVVGQDTDL